MERLCRSGQRIQPIRKPPCLSDVFADALHRFFNTAANQRGKPNVALDDDDEVVPMRRAKLANRVRHGLGTDRAPKEVVHAAVERAKAALTRNSERAPEPKPPHGKARPAENSRDCEINGAHRLPSFGSPHNSISARTARRNTRPGANSTRRSQLRAAGTLASIDLAWGPGKVGTRAWTPTRTQGSLDRFRRASEAFGPTV